MRFIALLFGLTAFSTAAYAGCENYTDGSLPDPAPVATICYAGECETTTVDFTCANVHSATVGFANGWLFEAGEEGDAVSRDGTLVTASDLTCKQADGDECPVLPAITRIP